MAVQDRSTFKAGVDAIITTNANKDISGADVNNSFDNLADSVIFYNENQSKENVRVATTADGALATAYENGQSVDGVTLATGDRILIKDQSTASENGIYTVNASGAPTRALDFDSSDDVILGNVVYVEEGTVGGGLYYYLSAPTGTITIGSSNLTFTTFPTTFDIAGLSALTTFDRTNDHLAVYDNSGATNMKSRLEWFMPVYGTFTPTIAFGGGSTGVTYVSQTGSYVETLLPDGKYKIEGRLFIEISSKGSSSGQLQLGGLPRACIASQNFICQISWDETGGGSINPTTGTPVFGRIEAGNSYISVYEDNRTDNTITEAEITTSGGTPNLIIESSFWYLNG